MGSGTGRYVSARIGRDTVVVSRHLSRVKAAAIVADDRRGKMIDYRLLVANLPKIVERIDTALRHSAAAHQSFMS